MKKKRLITFNVYYAPRSFGGATIVAEQVNNILAEQYNYEVLVVTTMKEKTLKPFHIKRYHVGKVSVVAINLPGGVDYTGQFLNEHNADIIRKIVDSFKPDVAHLHAIQQLGASFIRTLSAQKVPIFATLHDCWWICDRQFMINKHEKYCFQNKIDPSICLYCVNDVVAYERRQNYLHELLPLIDYYLFPSAFHRVLHVANGLPEEKCFVNKNGVKVPKSSYSKNPSDIKVRFGFIGGPGRIKGAPIIQKAFEDLEADNYELIVVDGAQNIGRSWKKGFKDWKINGKLTLVPAFTQDTMDDYYKNIDVLLFPSQWKESFGLTVREALLRDIFIISTNGGGTTEDLVEQDNAFIIPITNDPEPLKKAILKVLDRDWKNYSNKHKNKIRTYEGQAKELDSYFSFVNN